MIAEGKVDCCFSSSGNTKEWDTCAPQIIVEESGGHFTTFYGDKITYNREDVYNRNGYAAYNASTENNLSVQLIESKNNFLSFYMNEEKIHNDELYLPFDESIVE